MASVVIIGPGHPLRGGLATFNERLARQFLAEGHRCTILSFALQYPSVLFPGKTQFSSEPAPAGLSIDAAINSVNPANWVMVGNRLRKERPDMVVVRFWIPFMGPALGTILRLVRRNRHTRIVCIADNVLPHEKRPGDIPFISYFLATPHAFVTMSDKVLADLRRFQPAKPAQLVKHPLYDSFGAALSKPEARRQLGLAAEGKLLLFFGFIRKYKGLDLLLTAMADERIRSANISLLVAGEFYEDAGAYKTQIAALEGSVILHDHFIADTDVRYYLSAADCVVQPYRAATQSGVTPLAYHFEKPMVVTNVGGLPDLVPDGKCGIVCEPEPTAIATAILRFYELGEDYFIPHLRTEKRQYAWENLTRALFTLAGANHPDERA